MQSIDESYKQRAESTIALLIPVTIQGEHMRDENIPFHLTVKCFGPKDEANEDQIAEILSKFEHQLEKPIGTQNITLMPYKIKGCNGDLHHVLLVYNLPHYMECIYKATIDMGHKIDKYLPHITIEPELWEKLNKLGTNITAGEVGLKFHPAELRFGTKVAKTY